MNNFTEASLQMQIFYIGIGGFFGAITRHLVGSWVLRHFSSSFPLGTFVVNMSGCLLMGFLATLVGTKWSLQFAGRNLLFVGFLGAYTTFSTYMLENFSLLERGKFLLGFGNMLGSIVLGLLAFMLGFWLAKIF